MKKETDLNWLENFKIESRHLKVSYELRAFFRRMKTAFSRSDYQQILNVSFDQKTLLSIYFKTYSWFFEILEDLRENLKLSEEFEKLGRVFML